MNINDEIDNILDLAGFQIFPGGANENKTKAKLALTRLIEEREREAQKAKDNVYRERDQLVAALSKLWPAHLAIHPLEDTTWENDWRLIVCIHSPVGQMTWHIHNSEEPMFKHLGLEKNSNHWDGHTTEEKYNRLAQLTMEGNKND